MLYKIDFPKYTLFVLLHFFSSKAQCSVSSFDSLLLWLRGPLLYFLPHMFAHLCLVHTKTPKYTNTSKHNHCLFITCNTCSHKLRMDKLGSFDLNFYYWNGPFTFNLTTRASTHCTFPLWESRIRHGCPRLQIQWNDLTANKGRREHALYTWRCVRGSGK